MVDVVERAVMDLSVNTERKETDTSNQVNNDGTSKKMNECHFCDSFLGTCFVTNTMPSEIEPIYLCIAASDHPLTGWQGIFSSEKSPEFKAIAISHPGVGGFVLMDSFVNYAAWKLTSMYPGRVFVIDKCEVEDGEDAGFLPSYLLRALLKERQAGS